MAKPHKKNPEIYTIDSYQPFIKSLAEQIIDKADGDFIALSKYTILLPNRRDCTELKNAFCDILGDVGVVPNIITPQDIGRKSFMFRLAEHQDLLTEFNDLPDPISSLQRQVLLAKEIAKTSKFTLSVHQSMQLGKELGRLIDVFQKQEIPIEKIRDLFTSEYKEQWQETVDFLNIAIDKWSSILKRHDLIDRQDREQRLINICATYLERSQLQEENVVLDHPIVAAGFSDMSPSIIRLLGNVSSLPLGCVVLGGVDVNMDQENWQEIQSNHPQYNFKKALDIWNVQHDKVDNWKYYKNEKSKAASLNYRADMAHTARTSFIREIMRSSATSDKWSRLKKELPASKLDKLKANNLRTKLIEPEYIDVRALSGVSMVETSTPQEEASVIALKLREALKQPDRTITLVTNDRMLARRVSARLRYWGINVEDEAGKSLTATSIGSFASMTADMAIEKLSPIALLSCLKHPFFSMGYDARGIRHKIHMLEENALRGTRPIAGFDGIEDRLKFAFNQSAKKKKRSTEKDVQQADEYAEIQTWLADFQNISGDFIQMMSSKKLYDFKDFLTEHIKTMEKMAVTDTEAGSQRIWSGSGGKTAKSLFKKLYKISDDMPKMTGKEYAEVLKIFMADKHVMPDMKSGKDIEPNIRILTPEQAKFVRSDVMIMGAMNENLWPLKPAENLWMSSDMLAEMGLPTSDNSIGHMAYDFAQILSNHSVMITRAKRDNNAPTVPSSFLTRLMTVLKGAGLEGEIQTKSQLVALNKALHLPSKRDLISRPKPTPPVEYRPSELPVTAVETWLRDPYSLYAKYILKLRPKPVIDASPSYAERGMMIHDILEKFVKKYPNDLPDNAYDELIKIGKKSFEKRQDNPSVRAFWWPRFQRIAGWFIKTEQQRREMVQNLGVEVKGRLELDMGDLKFVLTAIADRVDLMGNDRLSIIDYKTGGVPTQKSVSCGMSPQLTLEALIARSGGFSGIDTNDVGSLEYWKLSGGRPAGRITHVNDNISKLENAALDGLRDLIEAFDDKDTPYLPVPRSSVAPRFNDYSHLSRIEEWRYNTEDKKPKNNLNKK